MKTKLFFTNLLLVLLLFMATTISAQEYHFTEGFSEDVLPAGWATQDVSYSSSTTNAANMVDTEALYCAKMKTNNGDSWLQTPQVIGAGDLSFWCKVRGADKTPTVIIQVSSDGTTWTDKVTNPAGLDLTNSTDFQNVTVALDIDEAVYVRFYVSSVDAGSSTKGTLTVDDIQITKPTAATDDVLLASLAVAGTLIEGFDINVTSYTMDVSYAMDDYTVTALANNANATVVITQVANIFGTEAERTATIEVTSEDNTASATTTIVFTHTDYWYKEGFSDGGGLDGWERNNTFQDDTPLETTPNVYPGGDALKFTGGHPTGSNTDAGYLLSPKLKHVGTLTFWVAAEAIFDLHELNVYIIKNDTDSTLVKSIVGADLTVDWQLVEVVINESTDSIQIGIEGVCDINNESTSRIWMDDFLLTYKNSPTVVNVIPANGANTVAVMSDIVIEFSKSMDVSSVKDAISFTPAISNQIFTWNENTLTITGDSMAYYTSYAVVIAATAADTDGNTLTSAYEFEFTTDSENSLPTIANIKPADGSVDIAIDSSLTIVFSKSMNTISVENALTLAPAFTSSELVWSQLSNTLTISGDDMENGTEYLVTITNTAADIYGNVMENDYFSSFSTVKVTAPTVVSVVPVDAATDVAIASDIVIEFSQEMDTLSVEAAFTITPDIANKAFAWNNNTVTISGDDMQNGTNYTITIGTTAADLTGLTLESDFESSFTTIAELIIFSEIFIIDGGELDSEMDDPIVMPEGWWVKNCYSSGKNNYDISETDESVAIMFKSNASYLETPAVNKPGVLTFWGKHKEALTGGMLKVEKSVDGADYILVENITTLGDEYAEFSVTIDDLSSNVKIKFSSYSGDETAEYKFYLDNMLLTESTATPTPNPIVKTVTPANTATDVSITSDIVIEFSSSMNTTSVENALTLDPAFSSSKLVWSQVSSTLTISDNNMLNGTKYDVLIDSSASDLTGLTLESDFASSFTTIATTTETFTVTFNVSDNNGPIEGAEVEFQSTKVNTDASGVAEFVEVETVTDAAYTVSKEGYDIINGTVTVIDTDLDVTVVMSITSLLEVNSKISSIYPNPVSDELTIEFNGKLESIEMISLLGKTIFVKNNVDSSTNIKIDVSNLDKGVYLIRAYNQGQHSISKVIVK